MKKDQKNKREILILDIRKHINITKDNLYQKMDIINTQPKYENDNIDFGYACDIRKQYGPFTKYTSEITDEVFKNGKPKYKCTFSACDGFIYAIHDAVMSVNQKTKEEFYNVRVMSINKLKLKNKQMDNDQKRIREELEAEAKELKEADENLIIPKLEKQKEVDEY